MSVMAMFQHLPEKAIIRCCENGEDEFSQYSCSIRRCNCTFLNQMWRAAGDSSAPTSSARFNCPYSKLRCCRNSRYNHRCERHRIYEFFSCRVERNAASDRLRYDRNLDHSDFQRADCTSRYGSSCGEGQLLRHNFQTTALWNRLGCSNNGWSGRTGHRRARWNSSKRRQLSVALHQCNGSLCSISVECHKSRCRSRQRFPRNL